MSKIIVSGMPLVVMSHSVSVAALFANNLYSNKPKFHDRGGKLKQGKIKYPNRFR